jgi:hypothetical protein
MLNNKAHKKMENLAKSLENKQILVVRAETYVNNKTNKSKITNKTISLGLITSMMSSTYFEQIILDDKIYIPMHDGSKIILWAKTYRAKNIHIEEFQVL